MRCDHCPVSEGKPCHGEEVGRFCELTDRTNPSFNNKYVDFLKEQAGDLPAPTSMPGLATQAVNFTRSAVRHAVGGFVPAGDAVQNERLAICQTCDHRDGDRCLDCGCPLKKKTSWASDYCPIGKWDAVAVVAEKKSTCSGCG